MRLDSIGLEELAPWSKYSGAGSVISCSIPWYRKGQELPAPVSLGTPMICCSVYCPLRHRVLHGLSGGSDSSPGPIFGGQVNGSHFRGEFCVTAAEDPRDGGVAPDLGR